MNMQRIARLWREVARRAAEWVDTKTRLARVESAAGALPEGERALVARPLTVLRLTTEGAGCALDADDLERFERLSDRAEDAASVLYGYALDRAQELQAQADIAAHDAWAAGGSDAPDPDDTAALPPPPWAEE